MAPHVLLDQPPAFRCGRDLTHGWQVGQAAFWGRLLGTAGKLAVGAAIVAVVLAGLLL
jgi:hypothetical protein